MVYERVEQDFLRHPDGVSPVWRRKAVLKYWAPENPHAFATSETLRSVCASILRAPASSAPAHALHGSRSRDATSDFATAGGNAANSPLQIVGINPFDGCDFRRETA